MRYIAFLRAINVGGHVVTMDRLRELFESAGLTGVQTYIASGNVVFESRARSASSLEAKIASHLERELGYEVATFLRTADELAEIAAREPFPKRDGATLHIGFLANALTKAQQVDLMKFRSPADEFAHVGREIYWSCSVRSSDSEFSLARLERALNLKATFRNANTPRKMAKKFAS